MRKTAVVHIDSEIAEPGDGATPATALAELPPPDSLAADTRYLIRRTATPLVWGTGFGEVNVDLPNVYLLGMPKSGDWLWHTLPPETQTAWGADPEPMATVKFGNPSLSVRFRHHSGNGGVHRLCFLVPHEYGESRDGIGFLNWANANHSSSGYEQQYDKAVFMTDCEWRIDGLPIDNPECVEECRETITSWFSFWFCKTIEVRNCRFVYPGKKDYNSFYYHTPFYFYHSQRAVVTNNDFWIGTYDYSQSQQALCRFYHVADVTFTDNRNRYVVQQKAGRDAYLRGWYHITGSNHTRRNERNTSRIERFYDPESLPNRLYLHNGVIHCETNATHVGWDRTHNKPLVQDADLDVDMTPCWESYDGNYDPERNYGTSAVYLGTNNHDSYVRTQYVEGYTRNIRVIVPRDGGIGRANIPWALHIDRPGLHHTGDTLRNLEVRNYRAGALNITGSSGSNYEGQTGLPPLELGVVEGGVRLFNLAFASVERLEVGRPDRFLNIEGSTVYLKNVVADAAAWNNHQVFLNTNNSRIVIDRINVPVLWPGMNSHGRTGLIVNSDGGVQGRWRARNEYYFGENWNARREGGAISCLKLWGTSNARLPLQVGFAGFRNFRVTAPAPGRYFLRIYGAHKMFAEESLPYMTRRVVVKAEVKTVVGQDGDGNPIVRPYIFDSQNHGWWEDDDSVWQNDDGLNPVVCIMPLDLPDTGNAADLVIDVRLEYDWHDQRGYFDLDPLPILSVV